MAILQVEGLEAGYNGKPVLRGVSFTLEQPKVVAVIGHNGAGKSTLLRAMFGLLKVNAGSVRYEGKDILHRTPAANVVDGIAFVPQNDRVFPELTVFENLEVGGHLLRSRQLVMQRIESVFVVFPALVALQKRRARTLSGGEQQMVALGRALMLTPRLLLVDEPSIGLSESLVTEVHQNLHRLHEHLGTSVMVVEQNVRAVLEIADWLYILREGRLAHECPPQELIDQPERLREFLS